MKLCCNYCLLIFNWVFFNASGIVYFIADLKGDINYANSSET